MTKIVNIDSIRIMGVDNDITRDITSRRFTYTYEDDSLPIERRTQSGRGFVSLTTGDTYSEAITKALNIANSDLGNTIG